MKILAAIDIGTNSIRLEVVRIEEDHSLTTISQQKETVRLGEGEFDTNRMSAAAIERGVLVCARFADVARGFGADEVVAFATSAVREAENQADFIERAQEEAGIEVRVISGPEEARLIYLGVSSGADLGERRALFIDIGGGSTELILGDAQNYFLLDSMKLGSIRLANRFLRGETGPISAEKFQKMKQYVRATAGHAARPFVRYGFDMVYGSAGTITNLADVTARRLDDAPTSLRNYSVKVSDLRDSVEMLCKLPLEERRKVPGLDPDRADIIIGGAAVLMEVLEGVQAERITISDRGLRHGILVDRLMREDEARATYETTPVRLRSTLQLARSCNYDEPHAEHVANLSVALFDEMRRLGYHPYGRAERELLRYAAIVHDIGCFLSHSNHQRHAYYLVRYSDLLGFTDAEIAVIANVAYYHRKSFPKKRHENLRSLTKQGRNLVSVLASFLRIAEGLDRSHLSLVKDVMKTASNPRRLVLSLLSEGDCQLEQWGVEGSKDLFEATFKVPLEVCVEGQDVAVAPPRAGTAVS
jgi:exopolyphosphatase / guanosine-5'-triphosphate,3'-diphosphate pyrophosphatase